MRGRQNKMLNGGRSTRSVKRECSLKNSVTSRTSSPTTTYGTLNDHSLKGPVDNIYVEGLSQRNTDVSPMRVGFLPFTQIGTVKIHSRMTNVSKNLPSVFLK